MSKVIKELQDLTYLKWDKIRRSSGTAGSFLKAQEIKAGVKYYYKLSNYNSIEGIVGHESINELVVSRLLEYLEIRHLDYDLIHALVMVDDNEYETYFAASKDFKKKGDSKNTFETYYELERKLDETPLEFCIRQGWREEISTMFVIDFLIQNRDRHGANIEVLKSRMDKKMRMAPLFDHGLSFAFDCHNDNELSQFNVFEDRPIQSFVGGRSSYENLRLIEDKDCIKLPEFDAKLKRILFEDLEGVVSKLWKDTIWDMLMERRKLYEDFCSSR